MTHRHGVDIERRDPRRHDQIVAFGYDLGQRIARPNHLSDRVHTDSLDDAAARSPHVDTRQDVGRDGDLLVQIGHARADLCELLDDVLEEALRYLPYLQLRFLPDLVEPRHLAAHLPKLTLNLRSLAHERQ